MTTENIFEYAARNKLRFPFKGMITTEDMFDLSVQSLDSIFKKLNAQLKQTKEESLLDVKTKADEALDTMIEIVKYIVSIKLAEENTRLQAREKKEKKQRLLEILASKQDAELLGKSTEEIQKMINELD